MLQLDIFTKPIRESAVSGIKEFLRKKTWGTKSFSLIIIAIWWLLGCASLSKRMHKYWNNQSYERRGQSVCVPSICFQECFQVLIETRTSPLYLPIYLSSKDSYIAHEVYFHKATFRGWIVTWQFHKLWSLRVYNICTHRRGGSICFTGQVFTSHNVCQWFGY